jgi:glucose-6-phosphate isomerase
MPAVAAVWSRIETLCSQWTGVTDVIHIGIGGSDFGPRLAIEALAHVPGIRSCGMRMHFLANIDTAELARILTRAQAKTTRVIIVSKSFTTLETTMNAKAVVAWLKDSGCNQAQIADALYAVTANTPAAAAFGVLEKNIFPFWDWVGGRYSVWSAVGLPIALQYGFETFREFLAGAEAMDLHFKNAPLEENLPVIMALALLHQQKTHGIHSYAVIPYADALDWFPKWLQQLDMESNGKSVDRDGKPVQYSSPVVFGSAGSNAQHSYFQMLHQGTEIIPIDFIAVREPMSDRPEAVAHHRILLSNCLAQAQALANGKGASNPNDVYPGQRPSNLLLLPKLNAFYLGALLALYENRAASLGALWNINSFDQPGVEYGKVLAKPIEKALASHANNIVANEHIDAVTAARINFLNS